MNQEDWQNKIKKVIKEKDSRFWLMLFVVVSTLCILIIWTIDLKNIFPKNISITEDSKSLGLNDAKNDLDMTIEDFLLLLDKIEQENSGTEKNLNQDDFNKIKEAVDAKINDEKNININTSSIPVISQELDESEQEINELKRKLEELEKKLSN